MNDPSESYHDANIRIRNELDKLLSECKDDDQFKIRGVLSKFMREIGMNDLDIEGFKQLNLKL